MTGKAYEKSNFLNQSRHSRSGLALVIGLHGGALALAFLIKSGAVPMAIDPNPPVVSLVPNTPPPEPIDPPQDPRIEPPPLPFATEPPIPIAPVRTTRVDPVLPSPPLPMDPIIAPPIQPAPVIRGAQIVQNGRLQPAYPGVLLRQDIEGSCTIRVRIAASGRVVEAVPVAATHPEFCAATQRHALRRWQFEPATRDGVPVESWQQHIVEFRIS